MGRMADANFISVLVTWFHRAGPAMSCRTRLAWGFLAGRPHMSDDSDEPAHTTFYVSL
jgi:hypothetical protein